MIYVILFVHNHWWRRIVDLAAWLPLVAPWVVIMTTHVATGGCGADGLTTFDFRWRYGFTIYHDVYVCVLLYLQMYSYVNLSNKRLLNLNLNLTICIIYGSVSRHCHLDDHTICLAPARPAWRVRVNGQLMTLASSDKRLQRNLECQTCVYFMGNVLPELSNVNALCKRKIHFFSKYERLNLASGSPVFLCRRLILRTYPLITKTNWGWVTYRCVSTLTTIWSDALPLSESMLEYIWLDQYEKKTAVKFQVKVIHFYVINCIWKPCVGLNV